MAAWCERMVEPNPPVMWPNPPRTLGVALRNKSWVRSWVGQVTDETPAADEIGSHFPACLVSRRILDLHLVRL